MCDGAECELSMVNWEKSARPVLADSAVSIILVFGDNSALLLWELRGDLLQEGFMTSFMRRPGVLPAHVISQIPSA